MDISLSGAKTYAYSTVRDTLLTSGDTVKNTWYEIKAVASAASTLPIGEIGAVFKSPDALLSQITLAAGDEIYPLILSRICKTDAEVTFEEGVIDVTDDCEEGFTAEILDGYKKISGTLNGFAKFNDDTGVLSTGTALMFDKFINKITDDGDGTYVETKAANEKLMLFILLNKNAAVDDTQNWIIVPVVFTSLGSGAGLKDAQKRDIAWTKAQGYVSLYRRIVFADDVV